MMLRRSAAARFVCRDCTRLWGQQQGRRWMASAAAEKTSSVQLRADDIYDVVCVGGGPAGLSLLTALRSHPATAGLRLALVEAQDLDRLRAWAPAADRFENRCSSLTPASARFLAGMGAWAHLRRERVQGYEAMQVWDGVTGARIDFDGLTAMAARPETGSTVAYMVENNNLTSALLRRLDELGGVTMVDCARVAEIGYGPAAATVASSGGEEEAGTVFDLSQWPAVHLDEEKEKGGPRAPLLARLLVGADGANSPVRAFAGIEARGWDYGRHGVVATLQLAGGEEGLTAADARTAYQRFLPTGPVAMLPLPGPFATLVWSTTPERAALLKTLAPADFVAVVNAAFRLRPVDLAYLHQQPAGQRDEVAWRLEAEGWRSGQGGTGLESSYYSAVSPPVVTGVQEGSVASFPLRLRHADAYVGERVALVGDAAHTVHPLAGQGLNQGQGDVASLARAVADAVTHGLDLGVATSLAAYPAERYAANHVLMGVCDKLHKLYAVESGPLVPLRSWGLKAVDALQPLKRFIMSQAAGGK